MVCEATAYARAGLVGNPSDGYFGKTISISIFDFAARVTLYESAEIEIVPSLQDHSRFASVHDLVKDVRENGYYGAVRLLKATIRKFVDYCDEHDLELDERCFSIRYRTTIPRRLGLAGSSALVTASLRCLMDFYSVSIPKPQQANLILCVEKDELDIAAGLQDRVIQVYEGCVFMDFDEALMESQGYGNYEQLSVESLPNLFIAYRTDFGEGSEKFHNMVRERWINGDPDIVQAMNDFAQYAQEVRDLLAENKGNEIGPLLDRNFDRRRSISKLDKFNIEMVERARSVGAHGKFAGSGGAIIGTYEDEHMYKRLEEVYEETSTAIFKPQLKLQT